MMFYHSNRKVIKTRPNIYTIGKAQNLGERKYLKSSRKEIKKLVTKDLKMKLRSFVNISARHFPAGKKM